MKSKLNMLIKIELFRVWTKKTIIVTVALTLAAIIISILPAWLGLIPDFKDVTVDFSQTLVDILKVLVPFSVFYFASAIISEDIKNHWIRTILTHAVSKQDLYISKIVSTGLSVFIIMLCLGVLPLAVFDVSVPAIDFNYEFTGIVLVLVLLFLEGLMFISISAWFSCFAGGFMNVFLLGCWLFLDNVVIRGVLQIWLQNNTAGSLISDFFFPSGFGEAAIAAGNSGGMVWEFSAWGFAALALFLTLGLIHFNRINIDINSD
ncbi:MAG: hypothetical protein WCZ17_00415 [Candidatus Kapaibacterium sp.]